MKTTSRKACSLSKFGANHRLQQQNKRFFWGIQLSILLCVSFGITILSLFLGVGHYDTQIINGIFETPIIFLLNLLPVVVLLIIFYGIFGRTHWAFLTTAILVFGLAAISYYKLMFRDDPLMFADILYIKEAGNMANNYNLFLDEILLITILSTLLVFVLIKSFVRLKASAKSRMTCGAVGLALAIAITPTMLDTTLYNGKAANYDYLDNKWSSTQQYIAHGFIYPFINSINDAIETPPENYDEDNAAAILANYQDEDIPEDKKVNVISIMLEAYNDFSRFKTPELKTDVYEVWHALEDEGYSGDLVDNIFAGGTVNTERCFLTGYANLSNYRIPTNSYVWYFKDQGYNTEGMHPCYDWFYNRKNINQYLGFENYYFIENYFSPLTDGFVGMDDVFFPELLKQYKSATADGEPYFNFSVTYQGHGPYSDGTYEWDMKGTYVVESDQYTDEEYAIMENYFGSIYDTNQHLKEFTDALRNDPEPVVLVLFGDHNPWMGDGNSVYEAMGLNLDFSTEEGFFNYYSTRYIIWANEAAKEVLGTDFTGEGPAISPTFLMSELFELCGWEGNAYMQAMNDIKEDITVINTPTGFFVENGVLTDTLSEEGEELYNQFLQLEYYWRKNFAY